MKFSIFNFQFLRNFRIHCIFLVLIVLLASFLRLYKLGNNPSSLDWDEASLGYNAYSILKTGRDEFGRFLPVSIRSFEDYKPAMYTYLTVPSVAIFGLTEFAVRLPSAIVGTLTVLVTYFLVKELFKNQLTTYHLPLTIALLLAISPWHLQFSRVAFESNTGLFFVLLGIWLFLKGLNNGKWFLFSALFFSLSFYSYHSPRLIVPLLLIGWSIYFRKILWQWKKWIIISLTLGFVMLMPFLREFSSQGRARFSSVTVLSPEGRLDEAINRYEMDTANNDILGKVLHNRRIVYTAYVLKGYLDHFNLDFLFLSGDGPLRHHAVDMGMLYIWEAPFILLGILQLLKTKNSFPIFWWFLIAPAASAITTGTPHAVRALLYLPTYQIFTSVGLIMLMNKLRNFQFIKFLIFLIFAFNIYYYLESYYIHSPVEAAKDWQYGYKEAVLEAKKWEDQVDKIIFTYAYDQPHIFVLFYNQVDPSWYQKQFQGLAVQRFERGFGKYEFKNLDWEQDGKQKNVLIVGTSGEIPDGANIVKTINFPDGTVAFKLAKL